MPESNFRLQRLGSETGDHYFVDRDGPCPAGEAGGAAGDGGVALQAAVSAGGNRARVISLRGGIYRLSASLVVTEAAGALLLRGCPGERAVLIGPADGPTVAIRGGRGVTLAGLELAGGGPAQVSMNGARDCVLRDNALFGGAIGILLDHATDNRITGNAIAGPGQTGIELKDGSDGNVVADNAISGAGAPETTGGGVFLHGTRGNRIEHNTISDTAGFGIGVLNWDAASLNLGTQVVGNRLVRTAQGARDSGAIYVLGRSGGPTGTLIADNSVDRAGTVGEHGVGIYLDDSTSGALVVGNAVRGAASDAIEIHGGEDNRVENNLLELPAWPSSAVLFQAAPADTHPRSRQVGNSVVGNVIRVAAGGDAAPKVFVHYDGGTPVISGNFFVLPEGVPLPAGAVADRAAAVGGAGLLEASADALQAAAGRAIGFRPIEPGRAGVRRRQ